MFWKYLLSIIRILNTVFTVTQDHSNWYLSYSYASEVNMTSLADSQHN